MYICCRPLHYKKSHNTVRMLKQPKHRNHPTKSMVAGNWMIPVSSTSIPPIQQPVPVGHQGPGTVPHAPPPPQMLPSPQIGAADPLSATIMFANTNPYIIGIFMLLLNLGGRFLSLELTKKQEEFLQARWIRPLLFFTVIFISTRNLAAAFWVTILFFFVIWVVANENSPFCMIPSWCGHNTDAEKKVYEKNVDKLSAY